MFAQIKTAIERDYGKGIAKTLSPKKRRALDAEKQFKIRMTRVAVRLDDPDPQAPVTLLELLARGGAKIQSITAQTISVVPAEPVPAVPRQRRGTKQPAVVPASQAADVPRRETEWRLRAGHCSGPPPPVDLASKGFEA